MAVMICFYYSNVHFYFHFHFDRQQCRPEMREWILERDSCRDFFFLPPLLPTPLSLCVSKLKSPNEREREKNGRIKHWKTIRISVGCRCATGEWPKIYGWGIADENTPWEGYFYFLIFYFFESSGFWWRVASAALQTWRETRIKERDRRTWKVLKALKIEMMVLDNTFPRDSATLK